MTLNKVSLIVLIVLCSQLILTFFSFFKHGLHNIPYQLVGLMDEFALIFFFFMLVRHTRDTNE